MNEKQKKNKVLKRELSLLRKLFGRQKVEIVEVTRKRGWTKLLDQFNGILLGWEKRISSIRWYQENGYNISSGGDPAWNRGLPKEQQPMYGKRQSEHQKQRCSETHTGKKFFHTPKTKSKITKSLTGKIQSKETIENKSGEKSGRSKISGIDVRNIRNEIKYCTALELSIKYGISEASIWNIIGGKTWKSSKYKNEMTHYQWIDMIFKRIGLKRNAV